MNRSFHPGKLLMAACLFFAAAAGAQQPRDPYAGFDTTQSSEVLYEIKTVRRVNPDSAVVTISFGKTDGIFLDAEGNIMTSHNSGGPENRETVIYIASARIIALTDTSATASVKLYKNHKETPILPRDLLGLQTWAVKNAETNVFYELAKLDVLFLDNAREEVESKRDMLKNPYRLYADRLLEKYTEEIKSFYTDLLEYKDSTFTQPYKTGPYAGMNMHQVFEKVTEHDMRDFFHFVRKYPGKYIGGRWKINETFATWVLNNAPQGEQNREWMIPVIQELPNTSLSAFAIRYRFMIETDTLSGWTARVWELQNNHQSTAAEELCNRLLQVAQALKDKVAENEFYYTRSQLLDARGETREALKDALLIYNADKSNINYTYQLASLYGKLEEFDECFRLYEGLLKLLPDNINIKGNLGWYKLAAGKVDEAIPYCRAAYLGDPTSVAFTVNYGHTFLLKGNLDSAKYYYQKTLDNLYTPADYTTGPKTDFDLFFKKGWQRKAAAEMADWMEKEFNEKYLAITRGNEIWNEAKKEYDRKNYRQAAGTWKRFIELFRDVKEPPYTSIHNANNWIGSSYSRSKMYDSSLYFYERAMRIAREHLVSSRNAITDKDNDYLTGDYERLYNLSVTAGKKAVAEQYKMLYDAEAEKVTELFSNPSLHMIVISGTGTSQHQAAADHFYTHFSRLKRENDTSGHVKQLNGSQLTRDKLISQLEEVRKSSKPEDIFIFYYAGAISIDDNGSYINFNEKDTAKGRIPITDLMNNLDLVYAHKKMIITDQPSTPLLSLITTRYINAGRNAPEVIYLSPGTETPLQENGISLFTTQLVTTLTELQKNERFSAKDFVDKASFTLGRGQYYFPVLSFSFGKDFLMYENKSTTAPPADAVATVTRGTEIINKAKNTETASGPQKNYALLFGTNIYSDPGWERLSNPIHDVETLGKLLMDEFGFEVRIVKNPTLDSIETVLSEFRDSKNYGSNDQLFIFFAGHGEFDERSRMGYLVASDSKKKDPNYKSYLSYSDLGNKYLKNISCNRIFLALDACMAGTFFESFSVRGKQEDANAASLAGLQNKASGKKFYKGISSGGKEYVEDGKPGQHSPFAASFLETLWNKSNSKKFVTADEIIGEIKSNPPGTTSISEGRFHYCDPFSHFIFERKSNQKAVEIKSSNSDPTGGKKG